ncbi:MAG TPA: hypothetical protein PLZ06_08670 [Clostridia bacterium]|nr:hypothetical protein [Clostridia bacterium]HQC68357.1 hypothetical protein [Clostridia bacterium]
MSLYDDVNSIIKKQRTMEFSEDTCRRYETAIMDFEKMVSDGLVTKRGNQLLSIENKICDNVEINHSKNKSG